MKILKKSEEKVINLEIKNGQAFYTTTKFVGHLEGIIVRAPQEIGIVIKSELGYLVLHERQHKEVTYYAPRAHQIAPERNLMHPFSFDKFLINERMEIIITGPEDTPVEIRFRIS